jgi:hypothetical protein
MKNIVLISLLLTTVSFSQTIMLTNKKVVEVETDLDLTHSYKLIKTENAKIKVDIGECHKSNAFFAYPAHKHIPKNMYKKLFNQINKPHSAFEVYQNKNNLAITVLYGSKLDSSNSSLCFSKTRKEIEKAMVVPILLLKMYDYSDKKYFTLILLK